MKIKIDSLDKLFSQCIKKRDKVCQRCGGISGLQTAHFHGRAKRSTRWDSENSCLLCFGCHMYFHAHPLEFVEFFQKRLGEMPFMLLTARAGVAGKPDVEAIRLYLKAQIKEIE